MLELESCQAGCFVFADVEDAIQAGDLEDFADLGPQATEFQLSGGILDFFVQGDEFVECSAGHEFDGVEVQQEHIFLLVEDQAGEFIAQLLDRPGVHNLFVYEMDYVNAAIVHHIDTPVGGHRTTLLNKKGKGLKISLVSD